ncbi:MAG: Abi family protein [Bacteroidaceae bacterium]|nr:Abi family protein [Bacteroidaceae bacterium]
MNLYTKQPLSIANQIEKLKSQGLVINDEELAFKTLSEISYFRFAAYLRPMETDKETHQFKPNATFENAIELYEFDNALRQLLFAAIQRIEIALRSKIIQHFSTNHGAFWFMQMPLHNSEHRFLENLNALDREVTRSKDDFIKEHFRNYDKPEFPPAWKTLELASFGTLSKLYYNFADKKVKKLVAREFNLPQHEVLESWMRSLAALRNHCAHHARLWNGYLNATPQLNIRLRGLWIKKYHVDGNKLYAILCCIAYWLDAMQRGDDFKAKLMELLDEYPMVDTAAMGFPKDWQEEPLWKGYPDDATPQEICMIKGHQYLYNHPSLPRKAICQRCHQKWIADYSINLIDGDIWKEVDGFEGETRSDEELITKWH